MSFGSGQMWPPAITLTAHRSSKSQEVNEYRPGHKDQQANENDPGERAVVTCHPTTNDEGRSEVTSESV
jgi:hypothetical protein